MDDVEARIKEHIAEMHKGIRVSLDNLATQLSTSFSDSLRDVRVKLQVNIDAASSEFSMRLTQSEANLHKL